MNTLSAGRWTRRYGCGALVDRSAIILVGEQPRHSSSLSTSSVDSSSGNGKLFEKFAM